jgi:hypothetical protein
MLFVGAPGDNNVWLTSSSDSQSLLGGDVNSSLSLDMTSGETRMVCPNSVMPVTLIQIPYQSDGDDGEVKKEKEVGNKILVTTKHDTLISSNNGLSRRIKLEVKEEVDEYHHDYHRLSSAYDDFKQEIQTNTGALTTPTHTMMMQSVLNTSKLNNTSATSGVLKNKVRSNNTQVSMTTNNRGNSFTVSSTTANNNNNHKKSVNNVRTINSKRRLTDHDQYNSPDDLIIVYPKPAYSYSCLIAMALKNSPSGSLPVSEIYNFMCEHFPYFKTAPNGWKNSVRHNLSLNKCFEKIEKPATNGSQRKGCLWAMNPNKIGKMDEEVQKWSKKDKMGIKKSMVYPESLDALEKGELSGNYNNHNPGSIETIHSEMESEEEVGAEWEFKREEEEEEQSEEEEEESGDEEEESGEESGEEEEKTVAVNGSRLSAEQVKAVFDESDLSLSDFDIEVTEAIYNDLDSDKLKQRLGGGGGPFHQQLSGVELSAGTTYTFNPPQYNNDSPKRIKTLGGSTISGNYVYKPIGTTSCRRKSPLRPTVLSSLEADD